MQGIKLKFNERKAYKKMIKKVQINQPKLIKNHSSPSKVKNNTKYVKVNGKNHV